MPPSAPALRRGLAALAVLATLAAPAAAQSHRLLPLGDPAYPTIERLQRRGHLLGLNPTVLPYDESAVAEALDRLVPADLSPTEARWANRLRRRLRPTPESRRGSVATFETGGGVRATNTDRLDPARPVEATDATVALGDVNVFPNAVVQASLGAGPLVAQLGVRLDTFYPDDPDGLNVGNVSVFLRNEESHVGAVSRWGEARLGVYARQWGVPSGTGVFVSANPQPYDALSVRLGGERLAVRSFVAELDAATLDGRFTGRTGDRSRDPSLRRYLSGHRIDWRPAPWMVVSGMETMLTSGANASLSLPALLPTAVLSFLNDGAPRNSENNGIVGGLLWVQRGRTTVTGQLAFDDFDLFNDLEPPSIALTGQAVVSGLGDAVDVGVDLTVVTARAYRSALAEQVYTYALRSIGAPASDLVDVRLFADASLESVLPGLTVGPEARFVQQGEGSFVTPYPSNDSPTLGIGDAQRTLRLGIRADLTHPWWFVRGSLGVNRTKNDGF
ncbi:MAG TPA: hypothetical protein VF594_03605, partial [Rubricoccaceae bacterium]